MFNLENNPEEQNSFGSSSLYLMYFFQSAENWLSNFTFGWTYKGDFAESSWASTNLKYKTFLKRTFCLPGMSLFNNIQIISAPSKEKKIPLK